MELDAEPGLKFDNSGRDPLRVPGIGLAFFADLIPRERFACGANDWNQERLAVHELMLLSLINTLTD